VPVRRRSFGLRDQAEAPGFEGNRMRERAADVNADANSSHRRRSARLFQLCSLRLGILVIASPALFSGTRNDNQKITCNEYKHDALNRIGKFKIEKFKLKISVRI
jgi:hypothetical protein